MKIANHAHAMALVGLSLAASPLWAAAPGPPSRQQRACMQVFDAGFAAVAKAAAEHTGECITRATAGRLTGTLADCLAVDPGGDVRRAGAILARRAARRCDAAAPFGASDPAAVAEAAVMRELLLTYDLFGGPIDRVVSPAAGEDRIGTCQRRLLRRAQRCQAARYRAFRACTRRGIATGGIRDATGFAGCLDDDPRGDVAAACDAEGIARIGRCARVDVEAAFPGCGAGDTAALGRCVQRTTACGACAALSGAHGFTPDCDRLDNGLADGSCAVCPPAGPLPVGSSLVDDLATYVGFGIRRTGTPGAARSAQWLADELGRHGFAVEQQPFAFTRFDWDAAGSGLVVDGVSYDVVPVWFPRADTVDAELAPYDAAAPAAVAGKIALVTINARVLSDRSPAHLAIQAAIAGGARAVVTINEFRPEAVALNADAPFNETPWSVPVVIVGARHRGALAAAAGRRATVRIAGTAGPGTAANVVGRWTGAPGAPTFVVSTPYTGWFATAGERGPGIALFLALARWVAARNAGANYVFVAIAGMELGSLGERVFLDPSNAPPEPGGVAAWLHLGAGIVTEGVTFDGGDYVRTGPEYGVSITSPGPLASVVGCALPPSGTFLPVPPAVAGGSLAVIFAAGYQAFGLQGTNDLYHTAEDVLGRNTPDADLLQPVAVGLVRALVALGG